MTDIADEAQQVIALTESIKVNAIRDLLAQPGRENCEDCGEAIPAKRRELLPCAVTCQTCQSIRELKSRTGQVTEKY